MPDLLSVIPFFNGKPSANTAALSLNYLRSLTPSLPGSREAPEFPADAIYQQQYPDENPDDIGICSSEITGDPIYARKFEKHAAEYARTYLDKLLNGEMA